MPLPLVRLDQTGAGGVTIRRAWEELAAIFQEVVTGNEFAEGRLDEGRRVASWLLERHPARRPLRILDVGAGNGGISLGAANFEGAEVHSVDIVANPHFLAVKRKSELPMRTCVAVGERLPFLDATIDAVLLMDVLEHMERPELVGPEVMRVLKPGGECMITTPARARFFFTGDPHYGIPGLLLLPERAQRLVATHLFGIRNYDVTHIFWTVGEVVRLFPGATRHEAFWNRPYPSARSRQRDWLWYRLRNWQWDRIVVTK